jgi:predicted nucleic acid-binding Zn ribbon protein
MSTWRPASKDGGPRRIDEFLDRTSARLGGPSANTASSVFGHWEALVGPDIAAHAQPVSLHDRVLVLAVDQPAWAAQLRFMTADLLARIGAATGGSEVAEIRLRVAGERPSRKQPRRGPTEPS